MGLRMERKLWSITVGTDLLGIGKKPGPGSGLMIPIHPGNLTGFSREIGVWGLIAI